MAQLSQCWKINGSVLIQFGREIMITLVGKIEAFRFIKDVKECFKDCESSFPLEAGYFSRDQDWLL